MLKRLVRGLAAALAVIVFLPAAVLSQDTLAEGTWSGTMFPPDDEAVDLGYEVSYEDGALQVVLLPPPEAGVGEVPASEVLLDGDLLSFVLTFDEVITCSLYRQEDGHFEGECSDGSGESGQVTMFPPEQP